MPMFGDLNIHNPVARSEGEQHLLRFQSSTPTGSAAQLCRRREKRSPSRAMKHTDRDSALEAMTGNDGYVKLASRSSIGCRSGTPFGESAFGPMKLCVNPRRFLPSVPHVMRNGNMRWYHMKTSIISPQYISGSSSHSTQSPVR
jgi:hypothetical protein